MRTPPSPTPVESHSQVSSAHLAPGLLMPRSVKPLRPSYSSSRYRTRKPRRMPLILSSAGGCRKGQRGMEGGQDHRCAPSPLCSSLPPHPACRGQSRDPASARRRGQNDIEQLLIHSVPPNKVTVSLH